MTKEISNLDVKFNGKSKNKIAFESEKKDRLIVSSWSNETFYCYLLFVTNVQQQKPQIEKGFFYVFIFFKSIRSQRMYFLIYNLQRKSLIEL